MTVVTTYQTTVARQILSTLLRGMFICSPEPVGHTTPSVWFNVGDFSRCSLIDRGVAQWKVRYLQKVMRFTAFLLKAGSSFEFRPESFGFAKLRHHGLVAHYSPVVASSHISPGTVLPSNTSMFRDRKTAVLWSDTQSRYLVKDWIVWGTVPAQ